MSLACCDLLWALIYIFYSNRHRTRAKKKRFSISIRNTLSLHKFDSRLNLIYISPIAVACSIQCRRCYGILSFYSLRLIFLIVRHQNKHWLVAYFSTEMVLVRRVSRPFIGNRILLLCWNEMKSKLFFYDVRFMGRRFVKSAV